MFLEGLPVRIRPEKMMALCLGWIRRGSERNGLRGGSRVLLWVDPLDPYLHHLKANPFRTLKEADVPAVGQPALL